MRRILIILTLITILQPQKSNAQEQKFADRFLGDAFGKRQELFKFGIDNSLEYKGDFIRNQSGGIKTGSNYLYNLDLKFDLDGEKLWNIKGNKIRINFLADNGGRPNKNLVGSLQGVDNIEVSNDILKLYRARVEQSFWADRISLAFGMSDLNTEFYVSSAAGNFIKPEFGIGAEISSTGEAGPSIFPHSALAMWAKFKPNKNSYIQTAIFDAVASNSGNPQGTNVKFNKNDGVLAITEAGLVENNNLNKLALGIWSYSKKVDDISEISASGAPKKSRNQGFYVLTNYQLYKKQQQQLNSFFDFGVNDGNVVQAYLSWRSGIQALGFVPSRKNAGIGVALSQVKNSDKFMKLNPNANKSEYAIETYFRDQIYQGVTLQPDLQYIINSGTNKSLSNALVLGLRLVVLF